MLTVETIGRIRREHFIKGKTIKEIARDLKVSRNTVRKVLRSGETSFVSVKCSPDRSWDDGRGNSRRCFQVAQSSQLARTVAMMRSVATPGDGPKNTAKPRRRPTSR